MSVNEDLRIRQAYTLKAKIHLTLQRIREFYEARNGKVYVSFSGGKDSQVLLHLVRSLYPDVVAVFSNTGLEYPEIVAHVKSFPNTEIIKPKLSYRQVVEKFGFAVGSKKVAQAIETLRYPEGRADKSKNLFITGYTSSGVYAPRWKLADKWLKLIDAPFKVSRQCCDQLKKNPFKIYEKTTGLAPFVATMAEESSLRALSYEKVGCNSIGGQRDMSTPMAFWLQTDVLQYILDNGLTMASVYGDIVRNAEGKLVTTGEDRTGCIWCLFGIDQDNRGGKLNRIQRLAVTHPQLHKHCTETLGIAQVLDFIGVPWDIKEKP